MHLQIFENNDDVICSIVSINDSKVRIKPGIFLGDFYHYFSNLPKQVEYFEDLFPSSCPCPLPWCTLENIQVENEYCYYNKIAVAGNHFADFVNLCFKHSGVVSIKTFEDLKSFHTINLRTGLQFASDQSPVEMRPIQGFYAQFARQYSKPEQFTEEYYQNKNSYDHALIYDITDVEELIFSIADYLVRRDYKFSFCEHCGKLHAVKSLKQKYCERQSPFEKYSKHTCKDAVKNIRKHLRDQKDYLRRRFEMIQGDIPEMFTYSKDCDMYMRRVLECSNVENINAYLFYIKDVKSKIKVQNRQFKQNLK